MKPAAFEYVRPESIEEALAHLAETGEDAKVLAGGQSLVPMLNMRLTRPGRLIDINRLADQRFLEVDRKALNVGCLTRHADFEQHADIQARLPILARVVQDVAHRAIRNRGTFCGSVAHNDPSAEWPLMSVLLEAEMQLRSKAKKRKVDAADFFVSYLATALEPDELLVGVRLPVPDAKWGWGFKEFNRRRGDFAIVSAAAIIGIKRGKVKTARLALGGVGYSAMRMPDVEQMLLGEEPSAELFRGAAELARRGVEPTSDLQATAEFRTHLVGELVNTVLVEAAGRAGHE